MLLLHGGRIEPRIVRAGRIPKLRFYHIAPDGIRTYFAPRHPKRGVAAYWHAIWYEGVARRS